MKLLATLLRCALPALALLAATTHAQTWPARPVHMVFPYPAGSSLDAVGRLLAERAGRILGQPIVFENRPGANGILGTTHVARAAPDGYTIHFTTTSAFLLNSFLRKDLAYDPARSFTPVTAVADLPVALMVSSRVPANSTRELVQYLKQNPGKLNYGSVGNGSFNHLLVEQFKAVAGVDMLHVPYQGAAPVTNELMAGRIDASVLSVSSVMGQWKAGQVKVLSMMATRRSPTQPEVPAITEEFPSFRPFGNWLGIVVPANTPEAVIATLGKAFNAVLQQPDVRRKIEEQQWSVIGGSPEEFREIIASDLKSVASAFRSAGVKPE